MNHIAVELHERRTRLHTLAHLDEEFKALAFEFYRVHTDVDEEFRAVVHPETDRMAAVLHDHRDLGIRRSNHNALGRLDRNAVAHHLLREHLVLDLAHIDDVTRCDCVDGDGFLRADGNLVRVGGRSREECLETLADLWDGETDNDLECVPVADKTVCARLGECTRRSDKLGIVDRDAQTRCTVRHVLDVRRTAETVEEGTRLHIALVELHAGSGSRSTCSTCLFCLVVRFREEFVLHTVVRAAGCLIVLEQDDPAEHEEVDRGEAQPDTDLHKVGYIVIREKGNPVLNEAVNQTAAEVARETDRVECCGECRRENGVQEIEKRCDKEEGELDWLCDAAEHRRDRRGNEESSRLLAFFGLCTHIDCERCARQTEDLAAAMEGKAALGEEFGKGLAADHEVVDVSEPVCLNAAVDDRRTEDEREIDEVMQTRREEHFLRECVCPDTDNAAGLEEELELLDGVLYRRPDDAEEKCHRDHDDKTDCNDECRAFEDAEPVGDVRVIEVVVQERRAASDEDRAEHTHVKRLDVRDHCKPRAGSRRLAVVHAERTAVKREECGDEVVEEHVDDERFHRTACGLFLRKADGNGDREENGHLREHGPCALFDDEPEIVPECALRGDAAEQPLVLADDGHRHRQTEECKQNDGRIHRAAEPLHVLHDDILAECHVRSSLSQNQISAAGKLRASRE